MADSDTGLRQLRRPRQQWALRAFHDAGAFGVGAALRSVGERPDFGNVMLPAHTLVDLNVRWQPAPQWTLSASLDNLFDRAYQPTAGFNGKPRALFVSLAWQAPRR
jgi:vitamin B12 transporter